MRGDQQVVSANRRAALFQRRANHGVMAVDTGFQGYDCHRTKYQFHLSRQATRATLGGAVSHFAGHDDAGQHVLFAHISDSPGDGPLGLAHEV
jgi:hypothetical protein